jgi:hypothetical protein
LRRVVGIISTLQLAVTLAFALPVGLLGVQYLVSGRTPIGVALVVVALLMVVIEEYVTTPTDVPAEAAEKAAGAVVKDEDSE